MPERPTHDMANVFVESRAPAEHGGMPASERISCPTLHRVQWVESFIATGGGRQICHFRAPDAESVRLAYRQAGVPADKVWSGTVRDAALSAPATLVVERRFAARLPADAEEAVAWFQAEYLTPAGLTLVRAIVPWQRRRIVCICDGGGSETRNAPGGTLSNGFLAWSCRRVTAERLPDGTAVA